MTYPAPSNAWSADRNSLWWKFRDAGVVNVCQSQGRTIVQQLQREILADVPLAFIVDGAGFTRSSITADGNFGPNTFAGLRRMLEDRDVPASIQETVLADYNRLGPAGHVAAGGRGVPVSVATMACVIWMAVHRNMPWSSLMVPSDIIPIRFAVDAPSDGTNNGVVDCVDETRLGVAPGYTPGPGPSPETPVAASAAGDDSMTSLAIAAVVALGAFALTGKGRRSPF
jgi:hypothetical protein